MPSLRSNQSHDDSLEVLQSEIPNEQAPSRHKIDPISALIDTFRASQTVQQVVGFRNAKPFTPPPEIPHDLLSRFEGGLRVDAHQTTNKIVDSRRTGQTNLADILEEKESPVRGGFVKATPVDTRGKLELNIPDWISEKQAVTVAQRYTFLDSDSDSDTANDTTDEHADMHASSVSNHKGYSHEKHISSMTLPISENSEPDNALNSNQSEAASSPCPCAITTIPLKSRRHRQHEAVSKTSYPLVESELPRLCASPSQSNALANNRKRLRRLSSRMQSKLPDLRGMGALPVLVPSPGGLFPLPSVSQQSLNFRGSPQRQSKSIQNHRKVLKQTHLDEHEEDTSISVPRITIQQPSPAKASPSKKRASSSSMPDGSEQPLPQYLRQDNTTGLPILSADKEVVWKANFPGNTSALLTTLLKWSLTMWTLHNCLPNSKLFSTHPAFPYLVSPPKRYLLHSVSFYDTSVEPHKEIRFLGPGDAAEISYNEVDVFTYPSNANSNNNPTPRRYTPADVIKHSLGLLPTAAPDPTRDAHTTDHASTGEGRWGYILIKAQSQQGDEAEDKAKSEDKESRTPPHVLLAWHSTAVTAVSNCLHTVFADNAPPAAPTTPAHVPVHQHTDNLKHFSSLQNLNPTLRGTSQSGSQRTLRATSSSLDLPAAGAWGEGEIKQQEGAVVLHRGVVKMGRAGRVPLVEGWRVDVRAFAGWMEACGRGKGKVIMWRERDGAGR